MAGSPPVTPSDLLPTRPQTALGQGDSAANGQHPSLLRSVWLRVLTFLSPKTAATDTTLQSTPRARALLQKKLAAEQPPLPSERPLESGELRQRLLDAVSDVESYQRDRLHSSRRNAP
jgi:hypothetical protein